MSALLVLGLVPLIWSTVMTGVRYVLRRGREDVPHDLTEKYSLAAMMAPVVVGAVSLCLAQWLPPMAILPLPDYAGSDDFPLLVQQATEGFTSQATVNWQTPSLWSLVVIYLTGLSWRSSRLIVAHLKLRRVVVEATVAEALGSDVRLTDTAVPAFAWSRATIVVPQNLTDTLTDAQVAMVIAHERGHLRRGDTIYYLLLSWIDVLFWFNPFVRHQTTRCRLAAELACDAQVTGELEAGAIPDMRKTYAESLLLALKHTAGNLPILTQSGVPAVFSPSNSGEFRMRMSEIMRTSGGKRKSVRWIAVVAVMLLPLAGLQLAWAQGRQRLPTTEEAVYSPGKGTVVRVHQITNDDPDTVVHGGGKPFVVEIDHGAGVVSNFTVVDDADMKVGDKVYHGQLIGKPGSQVTTVIKLAEATAGSAKSNCPPSVTSASGGPMCVLADHISNFKDSHLFIAWGDNTELRVSGRKIIADMIYSDPKGEIAFAQGHIVLDDAH